MSEVEIIDEPVVVDEPHDEPHDEHEIQAPVPPTPKPKRVRKKAVPRALPQEQAPQVPAVVVNADFWGELLETHRTQNRAAKAARFENLVKF
jgi:hypothetical protein